MPESRGSESQIQPGGSAFHRRKRAWLRTGHADDLGSGSVDAIKKRIKYEAQVAGRPPLFAPSNEITASQVDTTSPEIGEITEVVISQPKKSKKQPAKTWETSICLTASSSGSFGFMAPSIEGEPTDVWVGTELGAALLGLRPGKRALIHGGQHFPESWPAWMRDLGWICLRIVKVKSTLGVQEDFNG